MRELEFFIAKPRGGPFHLPPESAQRVWAREIEAGRGYIAESDTAHRDTSHPDYTPCAVSDSGVITVTKRYLTLKRRPDQWRESDGTTK
jgi:hypothetical protein